MGNRNVSVRAEQLDKEDLMQLVGFRISKEIFGVNILMVQEIIRAAAITAVPNSPEFVEGVINLRGDVIPIIDLRKRLNLYQQKSEEDKEDSWILILDINGRVTGFIVDQVNEVLRIDESDIDPPPDIVLSGLENQYIKGVCDIGTKELLILLDFDHILSIDAMKRLKSFDSDRAIN